MRRFAELAAELTAEVRRREPRRPGERLHVERVAVARVGEVLRTKEVACGMGGGHATSIAGR